MLKRIFILSSILILLLSVSTFAAVPRLINFQGKLTNAVGSPETGSRTLTFSLYTSDAPGGTLVWGPEDVSVTLDPAGQFSTVFGSGGTPSNLNIDFSQPLWLEVKYSGQTFTPRQRLSAVPYAFYAITAESLAGGITQEVVNLTVNNYLTVSGIAEMTGFKMTPGANGYVLTSDIYGVGTWKPATGGVTQEVNNLTVNNYLTVSGTGDSTFAGSVGIGTTEPGANQLKVEGSAEVTGTLKIGAYTLPNTDGAGGKVLKTNGSGIVEWSDDLVGGGTGGDIYGGNGVYNRIAKFTGTKYIDNSTITDNGTNVSMTGNVGIGTSTPGAKLHSLSAGTTQLRLGYDASNFMDFNVQSDGSLQIAQDGGSATLALTDGRVGIGTVPGTTKLKVAGTIETTGGIKFPDGSIQTKAASGEGSVGGTNYWTQSGNKLYPNMTTWEVAIGTTEAGANKLKVQGTAEVSGLIVSGTGNSTFAGRVLIGLTAGDIPPDAPATLRLAVSGEAAILNGGLFAQGKIETSGDIHADGDIGTDGRISANGTGESYFNGGLYTDGNIGANGTINANGTGESGVGGNFGVGGRLGVGGNLEMTGSIITSGNLTVNGTNESIFNGNIRANKNIIASGNIGTLGSIEAGGTLYAINSITTNGNIHGISLSVNDINASSIAGCNNITSNWFTASYGINADGNINSSNGDINAPNGSIYGAHMSSPDKHFLIDHPLDPKNKVLIHSSVESPDRMNIYNGIIILDEKGEAVVELPKYFEALNKDHRYQLTPVGDYAPLYIKQKVKDNKFVIAGGKPGLEVCWMVTGTRQDAFALKNPLVVEEEKGTGAAKNFKKGTYLYPEGFK